MINLGKNAKERKEISFTPLSSNQCVSLGGFTYHVSRTSNDMWYLCSDEPRTYGNDMMFSQLGTSSSAWCKKHGIVPMRTGGIFPYMSKSDLETAFYYLQVDFFKKGVRNK